MHLMVYINSTWDLGVSDAFQLEDCLCVLDEDLCLAVRRVRVEVVLLEDGLGRRAIVGHVVVGPRLAARQLVALHKKPRNNYMLNYKNKLIVVEKHFFLINIGSRRSITHV